MSPVVPNEAASCQAMWLGICQMVEIGVWDIDIK